MPETLRNAPPSVRSWVGLSFPTRHRLPSPRLESAALARPIWALANHTVAAASSTPGRRSSNAEGRPAGTSRLIVSSSSFAFLSIAPGFLPRPRGRQTVGPSNTRSLGTSAIEPPRQPGPPVRAAQQLRQVPGCWRERSGSVPSASRPAICPTMVSRQRTLAVAVRRRKHLEKLQG